MNRFLKIFLPTNAFFAFIALLFDFKLYVNASSSSILILSFWLFAFCLSWYILGLFAGTDADLTSKLNAYEELFTSILNVSFKYKMEKNGTFYHKEYGTIRFGGLYNESEDKFLYDGSITFYNFNDGVKTILNNLKREGEFLFSTYNESDNILMLNLKHYGEIRGDFKKYRVIITLEILEDECTAKTTIQFFRLNDLQSKHRYIKT